jgi:hypothetical protein
MEFSLEEDTYTDIYATRQMVDRVIHVHWKAFV